MTTPMQMGAEPRAESEPAPQQQAETPRPARAPRTGDAEAAPQQMGAALFRDWAAI